MIYGPGFVVPENNSGGDLPIVVGHFTGVLGKNGVWNVKPSAEGITGPIGAFPEPSQFERITPATQAMLRNFTGYDLYARGQAALDEPIIAMPSKKPFAEGYFKTFSVALNQFLFDSTVNSLGDTGYDMWYTGH